MVSCCLTVFVRHEDVLRAGLLTGVDGDRARVHLADGSQIDRSVWCLRFRDRAAGQALRRQVRASVPPERRTGAGGRLPR